MNIFKKYFDNLLDGNIAVIIVTCLVGVLFAIGIAFVGGVIGYFNNDNYKAKEVVRTFGDSFVEYDSDKLLSIYYDKFKEESNKETLKDSIDIMFEYYKKENMYITDYTIYEDYMSVTDTNDYMDMLKNNYRISNDTIKEFRTYVIEFETYKNNKEEENILFVTVVKINNKWYFVSSENAE